MHKYLNFKAFSLNNNFKIPLLLIYVVKNNGEIIGYKKDIGPLVKLGMLTYAFEQTKHG